MISTFEDHTDVCAGWSVSPGCPGCGSLFDLLLLVFLYAQ